MADFSTLTLLGQLSLSFHQQHYIQYVILPVISHIQDPVLEQLCLKFFRAVRRCLEQQDLTTYL